jgi:hypothetical protein
LAAAAATDTERWRPSPESEPATSISDIYGGGKRFTLRQLNCPDVQTYLMFNIKGNNTMARLKPQSEVMKYFDYRLAIIQVEVGETNDEAWHRHLMETPDDIYATIRVFNS